MAFTTFTTTTALVVALSAAAMASTPALGAVPVAGRQYYVPYVPTATPAYYPVRTASPTPAPATASPSPRPYYGYY